MSLSKIINELSQVFYLVYKTITIWLDYVASSINLMTKVRNNVCVVVFCQSHSEITRNIFFVQY